MHNYGADISRLTMMVLRCGLILLELLGLLHLPRLFSLQFERLVLGRYGAKRAGCLFAYADKELTKAAVLALCARTGCTPANNSAVPMRQC